MTVQADQFASFRLLQDALRVRSYSMDIATESPLTVTYSHPTGRKWTTQAAHIVYPCNRADVRETSIRKEKAYEFARMQGFSTPYSLTLTGDMTKAQADVLLKRYNQLVVKPMDASLGRGLTLGITDYDQLVQAIKDARKFSNDVLVQEQVEGEELRFMVFDGKVEAVLLRQTARVIGDGASTIRDLINKENELRQAIRLQHISYPQLTSELIPDELLKSAEIPALGEVVELNKSTMVRGGASIYNVLPNVDASYIQLVEPMVQALGAGFIVVDVFCRNYKEPANDKNHWFIEFNTAPVLKLCYACRDGRQYDVATRLAMLIDDHLQR